MKNLIQQWLGIDELEAMVDGLSLREVQNSDRQKELDAADLIAATLLNEKLNELMARMKALETAPSHQKGVKPFRTASEVRRKLETQEVKE